jgi:hypothetical protein
MIASDESLDASNDLAQHRASADNGAILFRTIRAIMLPDKALEPPTLTAGNDDAPQMIVLGGHMHLLSLANSI